MNTLIKYSSPAGRLRSVPNPTLDRKCQISFLEKLPNSHLNLIQVLSAESSSLSSPSSSPSAPSRSATSAGEGSKKEVTTTTTQQQQQQQQQQHPICLSSFGFKII